MTLEEIVKQEGRQPDCSGYVTKYDIECSDGLTIRQGAFNDDNGRRVPMVWMHDHENMENVLGHIYLESRNDGVYGYGFFNDSPKGQLGKLYVDHGDISSFSIYANKLKKKARDVIHGMIREVSLVLAGANRGAIIDSPICHSDKDEDEGEGVICMGDDYGGPIYGNDEPLSVEEYLEHYGRKGMKWGKNLFKTEYEAHPREKGEEEEESNGKKNKAQEDKEIREKSTKDVNDTVGIAKAEAEFKQAMNEMMKLYSGEYEFHSDADYMKAQNDAKVRFGQALKAYVDSYKFDQREKEQFLNELSQQLESKYGFKVNTDLQTSYDKEFHNSKFEGKDYREEKTKEALPNTPGMNETKDTQEHNKNKQNEKDAAEQVRNDINKYIDEYKGGTYGIWNFMQKVNKLVAEYPSAFETNNDTVKLPKAAEKFIYDELQDKMQTLGWSYEALKWYVDTEKAEALAGYDVSFLDDFKIPAKNLEDYVNKSLDTLKNLGDKAVSKGKEVSDKAEDILDNTKKKLKDLFKHSDLSDEEAEDIIKHYISGELTMDDILEHAENEGGKTVREVFEGMSDEQQSLVFYFLKKARQLIDDGEIKHSEKEEDEMKHNVFDDAKETKENTLSHADMEKLEADVFKDAKSKGSLKDSFLAHAGDYGIDDIEYLFPDDRKVTNTPTWIKRPDGWVTKVMKGVSHSPFSRIKSIFADITEPDARARGYVKGNKKVEEVFGLLKRSTTPTTVYKKQKLDRDDIIDITDFDVVSWLKTEMRGMLDEELARAYLIGDGRSPASSDKINEQNIRPIYTDDDLFVIRKAIAITSSTTVDEKCKQFIRTCIKARKDYRGSGNPTLFTTEDMLTDLLLMEDQIGHTLYDSADKLATKLRVKEIVTVPVFENQTRISGTATLELMGIIVNLDDYKVGADKGGSVSMFEDFDIDYNQEKYLIETRCSGALTVPYSAIVIESTASVYLDVEADDPSETRYGKSVSDLQSDIVINDDSISGTLNYVTGYTGYSGDTDLQSGYYIALKLDVPNGATTTIAALNNGGSGTPVDLGSDDYAVGRITTKNAKIVVSTTLAGVTVSKTYSLRLLKFGPKS